MPSGAPFDNPTDYTEEFRDLGIARMRHELLMRRWDRDKLAAARIWVETEDNRVWTAGHRDVPARVGPSPIRKYAVYIATGLGMAYAAIRIFRTLRWGW